MKERIWRSIERHQAHSTRGLEAISCLLNALFLCRLINGLKGQHTELKDARFLFYGAGSSAVGVAQLLALLLQKQGGQSKEQAWKVGRHIQPEILPISFLRCRDRRSRYTAPRGLLRHLPVQGACRSRRTSTVGTGLHCTRQAGTNSGSLWLLNATIFGSLRSRLRASGQLSSTLFPNFLSHSSFACFHVYLTLFLQAFHWAIL